MNHFKFGYSLKHKAVPYPEQDMLRTMEQAYIMQILARYDNRNEVDPLFYSTDTRYYWEEVLIPIKDNV